MNYIKSCLIITMLLGMGYSQCNESNWEENYNSEGRYMESCYLQGAFLHLADRFGANLTGANLEGVMGIYTDFHAANINNTNFTGAYLHGAYFVGAWLEGAIFEAYDDYYLRNPYFDKTGDCGNYYPCDGYDDAPYDAGAESVVLVDTNGDGLHDVLDMVELANCIMDSD